MIGSLFEPKGVLVAGASSHPGRFGFVMLHNILASGYEGAIYATNPRGEEILGVRTTISVADLPDGVVDGAMRQEGVRRATTAEEAFEAAASFSSQSLPKGNKVAVVTTAGGWGVATADAISRSSLELLSLLKDLEAALDELLVSRWSRNNPIDLAGGETRDTIPLRLGQT